MPSTEQETATSDTVRDLIDEGMRKSEVAQVIAIFREASLRAPFVPASPPRAT